MQGGDLSNRSAPRLIFIFETTIGVLDIKAQRRRKAFLVARQWKRAAQCWTLDPQIYRVIEDLQWRSNFNVDFATYLDQREAEALEDHLEHSGLGFGNFLVTTVNEMARVYCNYPSTAAIFDGDPERVFTYGGKGRTEIGL